MGIGSWFKKRKQRKDAEAVERVEDEFFDTPEEQRMQSGDVPGLQADRQAGMLMRDPQMFEGDKPDR
jgi:hypothetical protein